jgi:hypothetical protein
MPVSVNVQCIFINKKNCRRLIASSKMTEAQDIEMNVNGNGNKMVVDPNTSNPIQSDE